MATVCLIATVEIAFQDHEKMILWGGYLEVIDQSMIAKYEGARPPFRRTVIHSA
jgi:hypothetical protein